MEMKLAKKKLEKEVNRGEAIFKEITENVQN